ncbi:hypothetical protein KVR01_004841 [Diaporthe batatas]|uniref:uncharacterized protein n=1 Tax=Diaporthe batatas TaxID=748121 RepID=UPI001D056650|nr:uncharacterized protein KVR01_004841 [Diaporthe batatas]KAG8166289.1 hypothetical protein KVR01_004841 [Diaporthe batatas]
MNHISSPNEPFPTPTMLAQATTTHRQGNFEISSRKLPISKSGPIDDMSSRLGIPIPEMIFGDNLVAIRHAPSGWAIEFAAEPALDAVDKTGANMLQVAYAGEWSSSRERSSAHDIREVVKPYDWSYSTTYRGSETPAGHDGARARALASAPPGAKQIPLELLKRRDPILFFDEVVLFESELDDNGVSVLSCKLRVMEQRMLLLCRLYMRLDGVVVRVRDTRVYVDFETDEVIREYTAKEDNHENVTRALRMSGLHPDAVTAAFRDANQVAHLLPVVEQQIDTPERLLAHEAGTERQERLRGGTKYSSLQVG